MTPDEAAVSRALRLAERFAARQGLSPAATLRLAVVVEEWVANIVEHGDAPDGSIIALGLQRCDGMICLSTSDAGIAFDPRSATFEGPNHERGGGAGMALIASLCRIAAYERRRERNRLVLELPL